MAMAMELTVSHTVGVRGIHQLLSARLMREIASAPQLTSTLLALCIVIVMVVLLVVLSMTISLRPLLLCMCHVALCHA